MDPDSLLSKKDSHNKIYYFSFFKNKYKEEKGTTEDEMAGWHHRLNGHVFG